MLNSCDLLGNFKTIAKQISAAQQGNLDAYSKNQAPMTTDDVQSMGFQATMYQNWLEDIDSDKIEQLRSYLTEMLVSDIIRSIISRMVRANKKDKALALAEELSQLPESNAFAHVYPKRAPNYFKFITMAANSATPPEL